MVYFLLRIVCVFLLSQHHLSVLVVASPTPPEHMPPLSSSSSSSSSSSPSSSLSSSKYATIHGRLRHPDPNQIINSTRVTLNDGTTHSTYTLPDGSFTFYKVLPGVHLLDVQCRTHHYSQIKVQLLPTAMDSPKCIEYVYPGAPKQVVPHPIDLVAHASYEYYEPRQGFSIMSIIKNPMLLMMLVSVGGMMFLPQIMNNLDPEQQELMAKQMAMQKDPGAALSEMFKGLTGGGVEQTTTTATTTTAQIARKAQMKSSGGGKTVRRGKYD